MMRLPAPAPSPVLAQHAWPVWLFGGDDDGNPEDELQNWSSLIGIVTAICGNTLIALALNVQRYAHLRLHRKRMQIRERVRQAMKNAASAQGHGAGRYGAATASNRDSIGSLNGPPNGSITGRYSDEDIRDSSETEPLAQSLLSDYPSDDDTSDDPGTKAKATSTYLKDPYWWLGQVLITIGEMGNFLAYGFAPASIVSPLGVVALIANCVIAPIVFKEVFRQRDFWGVIIAITGAVTVVLSANTEETKLGPHEVWGAITTMEFEIYVGVTCALIVLLMWLSPRYGNRTILIDLGLVGLFGAYTVLSTKGVSSMLSSTLFGAFATPVTYALVFILLSTAILQVRYVNKALQRFDSTQVIPIQFVLFTLSVIIGSAVLYRDFERTTAEQAVKFVGGCLFTFFGVFLITSGRPRQDDDDEVTLSDADGVEETIGLAEQDPASSPATPRQPRRSRGSSQASRVSFGDALNRPLATVSGDGFPTSRVPPKTAAETPLLIVQAEGDDNNEGSSLLENPWNDQDAPTPSLRPHLRLRTISDTAVPTVPSSAQSDTGLPPPPKTPPQTARQTLPTTTPPPRISLSDNRPATPRAPALSTARLPPPPSHVYSPSPFSSTLSAVVGDKLLAHVDGAGAGAGAAHSSGGSPTPGGSTIAQQLGLAPGGGGGGGAARRTRPGLRSSLFMPLASADEAGDAQADGGERAAAGGTGGGGDSVSAVERREQHGALLLPAAALGEGADNHNHNTHHHGGGSGGGGGGGGLRSRARSLSLTLGLAGLFGGGGGGGWGDKSGGGGSSARKATATRRDGDGSGNNGAGAGRRQSDAAWGERAHDGRASELEGGKMGDDRPESGDKGGLERR